MAGKASRRIKLSKNMRPFVSRVVRDGAIQRRFAEMIGHPTGQCVASRIPKGTSGYTGAEIHDTAKSCAPAKGTVHIALGHGRRATLEERAGARTALLGLR